ncbi:MAG: UDP-N-acetylmuramoyl-L-alanyl-D-glutamate--2,6-diaminopimelate ligase [Coriobacteriia bacterium]
MATLRLSLLFQGVEIEAMPEADPEVGGIAYRSDRVEPGDVFFCIPGFVHDGHDFAPDAVERGASAVVVKRPLPGVDVPQVVVTDPRVALAHASAAFFGHPSSEMRVVGITGTNGKTTSAYLVESILRAGGMRSGLLGTVEVRVGDARRPAGRTTPESLDLQRTFAEMREAGVEAVAMEVSSHAIDLHRVDAVEFAVVAFTNLSQDHLDYHKTMEEYFAVKKRLFSNRSRGSVVCIDDDAGAELAAEVGPQLTVGLSEGADVTARDIRMAPAHTDFVLVAGGSEARVRLPLAGAYNVSNSLLAAGCGLCLGLDLATVAAGLESAEQVPGRLERIECGQPFAVYVDYAHTPAGLEKAIAAVREVTEGRLITVFGCGGDRDPEKRPMMGRAAANGSDVVVVTSDNPRSEDPVGIILQIEDGIREVRGDHIVEVDRRAAIERAIGMAGPGDAVLIAGKGHEDYQIFADRTIHFDDREVAREVLGC